jgi:hypothetical protein
MARDILYRVDTYQIALGLIFLMILVLAIGRRLGRWHHASLSKPSREHAEALQTSFLTLIALLLGFTFSLALDRFADRSAAVVDEANAIGTAWLQTDLLPEPARTEARDLMRAYLLARLEGVQVSMINETERAVANAKATATADRIWQLAAEAARTHGLISLSYAQSVNGMIDAFGLSEASIRLHVPQTVLVVLFIALLVQGFSVGYSDGVALAQPTPLILMGLFMTTLTVSLILDLDRPRRGLVTVDYSAMESLAAPMGVTLP